MGEYVERLKASGAWLNYSCHGKDRRFEEWILKGGKVLVSVSGDGVVFKAVGCFVRHGAAVVEREDLTEWTASLDAVLEALAKVNNKEI